VTENDKIGRNVGGTFVIYLRYSLRNWGRTRKPVLSIACPRPGFELDILLMPIRFITVMLTRFKVSYMFICCCASEDS
jgi:hypothetical protein